MSFAEQERVLLSLLFDRSLRDAFLRDRHAALAPFDLTAAERADFDTVRAGGLAADAEMRRDLVLARLCRSLPLSFSISSALDPSLTLAEQLLTPSFFAIPSNARTSRYAGELREAIVEHASLGDELRPIVTALLDLELGVLGLTTTARLAAIEAGSTPEPSPALVAGWEDRRLSLAPNTGVFLLPRSYAELLRELCPCSLDELWARLKHAPLPYRRLAEALAHEAPRLLFVRAVVDRASRVEATVSQRTLELSDGFLPLLQQISTGMTARAVFEAMQRAGATTALVGGVASGLKKLIECQMLVG